MSKYDKKHGQIERTLTAVVTLASVYTTDAPTNTAQLQAGNGTNGSLANYSVPAGGGLMNVLRAVPRQSVTAATVLLLFVSQDGGATKRLIATAASAAQTIDVNNAPKVITFSTITTDDPYRAQEGDQFFVGASNAQTNGWVFSANITEFGNVE